MFVVQLIRGKKLFPIISHTRKNKSSKTNPNQTETDLTLEASFFPSLQSQFPPPSFDEKPKVINDP